MPDLLQFPGEPVFPGMHKIPLPVTPGGDAKEMLVAHRVDDAVRAVAHAEERMSAALKAATSELRGYHSIHIANHMAVSLNNMHFLVNDFKLHYPVEAAELEALRQCVGLSKALNKVTRTATTAHLTETVLHELTHAKRHADRMLNPDPKLVWEFDADHCRKHLKGAQEHLDKLSAHLCDNYPAEGRWIRLLKQLQDGHLETDSAAWKNLKLAAPGPPGLNEQFKLRKPVNQKPSQPVSPSPPLPPGVPLPTPSECKALVKLVPTGIDVTLSNTVRNALNQAANKLSKNDVLEALASLRQAQSALYAASKKDAGAGMPAVYGVQAVPPFQQSSALAQMYRAYQEQAQAWRKIGVAVASLIDRIRRNWFGGRVNGYSPNLRMSSEGD